MFADSFLNVHIIQALAWIFTVLSAVASIALTIHRFGLSPGKRIALIGGIIAFGIALVAVLIPNAEKWGIFPEANAGSGGAGVDLALIRELSKDPRFGGVEIRPDGSYQIIYLSEAVNRAANADVIQVEVAGENAGQSKTFVAYSGTAIDTEIDGKAQTLEILDSAGDEVIVAAEDKLAVVNPDGSSDSGWVKQATRIKQ